MAEPRRLLWKIARASVRRLFRERKSDLAGQMYAYIALVQNPFGESFDRRSDQASVSRGDQDRLSGPKSDPMSPVPDTGEPTPIHPAAFRAISKMDPVSRAVLILCVHHHVSPSEIADRFGMSRRRVRKHLRLAISNVAATRAHTEP
jgi:DNA-directed RNA polymerase specialized sigma24 family protein